jgi:hypothetical protein
VAEAFGEEVTLVGLIAGVVLEVCAAVKTRGGSEQRRLLGGPIPPVVWKCMFGARWLLTGQWNCA